MKSVTVFFLVFLSIFYLLPTRPPEKIRIGIISNARYCGEREVAWRIKIAAESLGWEVFLDEQRGRQVEKKRGLDWTICLIPHTKYRNKNCNNYITIFHPFNYIDSKRQINRFYEKRYDGYLLTIKPNIVFHSSDKPLFSIPFYPTLQHINYREAPLNDLMTMIPVWGNRRTGEKFKKIYKLLSQSGFTKFYGVNENPEIIAEGYMGKIPFDGISVIEAIQKHGIVLIFHSDIHNQEEIPSSRIFEAAAASTVIISDLNPFIQDHFRDTVFYVDTSRSAEEVYHQIQQHIDTIRNNPQMALRKAKQAHQIFVDHFLMTDQLLNIQSMHRQIIAQRARQWKFSYDFLRDNL